MDGVTGRRLSDVGEDGLVRSILARYGPTAPTGVLVGPGDDAAVLDVAALGGGRVVLSTDTVVEGQDFRAEWSTAFDVGVKVAAQNLADIAAMGARPVALLVALAAPPHLEAEWAEHLAEGLADECGRAGASVVGGDVSAAAEVVITGTAVGLIDADPVRRDGARPGDVVALAGQPGRSAAGLALLRAGLAAGAGGGEGAEREDAGRQEQALARLVEAHRAPRPPYEAGPAAAAAGASALIDTSDGLLRDADRVAQASGVVIDLDSAALAPSAALLIAAGRFPADGADGADGEAARRALEWVLTGGEDHCLLATFPPGARLPAGFSAIGAVRAAASRGPGSRGAAGVLVDGQPWAGPTGWHHFA